MVKPQLAPDGVVVPDAPARCQRTIGQSFVLKIQTHHFFPQQLRTDLVGIADQISFASTPPKRIETNLCGVASTGSPASAPVKRGDVELQNSSREACGIPVVVIPGQERGEVNHYDPHAREKMVNRYACLFRERQLNNRTIYPV